MIKGGILIYGFPLSINMSYVQYQLHIVYIYIHTVYIYGIINVTCACIFHSVDAIQMQSGKGNYIRAWTDNKKKMQ